MNKIQLLTCLIAFAFGSIQAQTTDDQITKFGSVLNYIDQFYVDDVDENQLVETAIKKMLKELDPHSVYISKEEVAKMNEPLIGNFEGVGIQFNVLNDTILVVATIPGGPSEKVGIQAGDKIIKIDNEIVAGVEIKNSGVVDRLRGKKGSEVTVEIKRYDKKRLIPYTIIRDKIPLFSVDASFMATPETGYIKVNRFAAKTPQEFKNALYELKEDGMKNLIVDLQGNSGGYLNAAFQMVDEFLDSGKLIVYTEGKNSPRNDMNATVYGNYEEGRLIILVDQYSASASEILSGAVQDWDRGLVIGRRTFGKGLVQRPFTVSDGSQIRLTIANYYTPSGRFIQKPYTEGSSDYRNDINTRFESGELTEEIIADYPDSLKFETANGRTVYGGGGVTPDIFVPLDTTRSSEFYTEVRRKGLLNNFALTYVDKHRDLLGSIYTTIEQFDREFAWEGELMDEFIALAEKDEIEATELDLEKSEKFIGVQLKALIARNIFDGEAFYYVYNKEMDDTYKAALDAIDKNKFKNYNIEWTKK